MDIFKLLALTSLILGAACTTLSGHDNFSLTPSELRERNITNLTDVSLSGYLAYGNCLFDSEDEKLRWEDYIRSGDTSSKEFVEFSKFRIALIFERTDQKSSIQNLDNGIISVFGKYRNDLPVNLANHGRCTDDSIIVISR